MSKKGFALGLVLKVRVFGARRKQPIANKWFLAEGVKQLTVETRGAPATVACVQTITKL